MAKILKMGYMEVPKYDLVCRHCGTLARYEKRELRFFEDCYDVEVVSYTCPHCHKETTILANRLPKPSEIKEVGEIEKEQNKNFINNLKMLTNWWGG